MVKILDKWTAEYLLDLFRPFTIQLIFTDFGLLKNLQPGKLSSHVVKNTQSRYYKALQLAFIWKYFEILKPKGQDNLQDPKVNIDLYRN